MQVRDVCLHLRGFIIGYGTSYVGRLTHRAHVKVLILSTLAAV